MNHTLHEMAAPTRIRYTHCSRQFPPPIFNNGNIPVAHYRRRALAITAQRSSISSAGWRRSHISAAAILICAPAKKSDHRQRRSRHIDEPRRTHRQADKNYRPATECGETVGSLSNAFNLFLCAFTRVNETKKDNHCELGLNLPIVNLLEKH